MNKVFLIILGASAFMVGHSFVASAQSSCLSFPSNSTPPSGYGASWDVFSSAKDLLVKSTCPSSASDLTITIGKGSATQYTWGKAYTYRSNAWNEREVEGTSAGGGWIAGEGTFVSDFPENASPSSPYYFVGYICTNRGTLGWKCGCANSACTTGMWQIQGYTGIGGSSGTGGGASGEVPADPPTPLRTIPVSSQSELSSALANAQPGDQIVLANGTYNEFTISKSGQAGRPIVIKSGQVGGATVQGVIQANGQYTWFHGIRFAGNDSGIDVGTDNITITRNSFTGLNGVSASKQKNIKIGYNEFTGGGADVDRGSSSQIFFNAGSGLPEGGRIYRNYFTSPQNGGLELHHIYLGHQGCKKADIACLKDFIIEYNLIENTERTRSIYSKYGGTIRFNQCNNCKGPFGIRHGNDTPGNGGKIWGNRVTGTDIIVNGANHDIRGNTADIDLRAESLSPGGNEYQSANKALLVGNIGTVVVGDSNSDFKENVHDVRICKHSGNVQIQHADGTIQQSTCTETAPATITLTKSQVGPNAPYVP